MARSNSEPSCLRPVGIARDSGPGEFPNNGWVGHISAHRTWGAYCQASDPSFPECQKTRVGRSPTTFSASHAAPKIQFPAFRSEGEIRPVGCRHGTDPRLVVLAIARTAAHCCGRAVPPTRCCGLVPAHAETTTYRYCRRVSLARLAARIRTGVRQGSRTYAEGR